MDYLSDGAITTLANPAGFLPLPIAVRSMIDVLQGLEHLHLNNFFHNDVKPQNILRGPQGEAKLADYGIVGVSPTGAPVMPSSWYVLHAAPETAAGNGIEARTDIFRRALPCSGCWRGLGSLEAKYNSLGRTAYEAALAAGSLISRRDFPPFIPNSVCRAVLTAIIQILPRASSRRWKCGGRLRSCLLQGTGLPTARGASSAPTHDTPIVLNAIRRPHRMRPSRLSRRISNPGAKPGSLSLPKRD